MSGLTPAMRGDSDWVLTIFGGQMTDNVWEEALLPSETKLIDSYLIGVGAARDLTT